MTTLRDLLARHEVSVNFGYEKVNCSCGWRDPDSLGGGVNPVLDGSPDWQTHQLRALAADPETVEVLAAALHNRFCGSDLLHSTFRHGPDAAALLRELTGHPYE